MLKSLYAFAEACLAAQEPFAVVSIQSVEGSTPRDEDATLLVSDLEVAGTIGGGRLEWNAIASARAMLSAGEDTKTIAITLGPDIGQCCGGRVTLFIWRGNSSNLPPLSVAEVRYKTGTVCIYGSGHVGRALAKALSALPFNIRLIDSRAAELAHFEGHDVELVHERLLVKVAREAPSGAAHVIMTHSHTQDSLVAATILEKNDFAYLGIIGSATKRTLFLKAFRETGVSEEQIARIVCPIGGSSVKDKRPEVIAALTAAEITVALLGQSITE